MDTSLRHGRIGRARGYRSEWLVAYELTGMDVPIRRRHRGQIRDNWEPKEIPRCGKLIPPSLIKGDARALFNPKLKRHTISLSSVLEINDVFLS